ncbi:MAG: DNA polymerase Y family protein [Myxococcota bacterium]
MAPPRLAAAFLPQLLVELSAAPGEDPLAVPLGVVLRDEPAAAPDAPRLRDLAPHLRLSQISHAARMAGLRRGMTVAGARSLLPDLNVRVVTRGAVQQALCSLAEACLSLCPRVSPQAPDALLLDVTGTAELFGGEEAWLQQLMERLRDAGHQSRVACASGPDVALAVARYGPRACTRVPQGGERQALWSLPVAALGFSARTLAWLSTAGLRTVRDLSRQPRDALARRLGSEARLLRLLEVGVDAAADTRPLVPHVPAEQLVGRVEMQDPEEDRGALLFWLKRAVDPLCARLRGRELAALHLTLCCFHGRGVPPTTLTLPLALPLWNAADMMGALRPLMERAEFPAGVTGLTLEISRTTERPPVQQTHLHPDSLETDAPRPLTRAERRHGLPEDALPRLFAELVAELGQERVGILWARPDHKPESATGLFPPGVTPPGPPRRYKTRRRAHRNPVMAAPPLESPWFPGEGNVVFPPRRQPVYPRLSSRAVRGRSPLRVLPHPLVLPGRPVVGETLAPGLGRVREVMPARRLWTEWWNGEPLKRDYFEVLLEGGELGWVSVEPHTGKAQLQGWMD